MQLLEVITLGNQLMREHGLTQRGWIFELDDAKRRFGLCSYRNRTISISRSLASLNDELKVKDTILHEIAHALVGGGHGHNDIWKKKCVEIGAKPERCYSSNETCTPKLRYYAICEPCGAVHQRTKRADHLLGKVACKCQKNIPWSKKKTLTFKDRFAE